MAKWQWGHEYGLHDGLGLVGFGVVVEVVAGCGRGGDAGSGVGRRPSGRCWSCLASFLFLRPCLSSMLLSLFSVVWMVDGDEAWLWLGNGAWFG